MEMDPDALWTGFVTVVKGAVQGTGTTVHSGLFIHNQSTSSDEVAIQTENKADKHALRYGHRILRGLTVQSNLQNAAVFACVVLILLCVW